VRDGASEQAPIGRIGVSGTVRRTGTGAARVGDVVDDHRLRRYLEHVPGDALLTERDVLAASAARAAGAVIVQPHRRGLGAVVTARLAHTAGARLVLASGPVECAPGEGTPSEGAPREGAPDEGATPVAAGVAGAIARESGSTARGPIGGVAGTVRAAAVRTATVRLARGPLPAALEIPGHANVVAGGFLPLAGIDAMDSTGSGDALAATRTRDASFRIAGRAAPPATTAHPGRRPRPDPDILERAARDRG
jgi:hypothetical protein